MDEQHIIDEFAFKTEERLLALHDERVELTSTEQVAIRRESIIQEAKDELARLIALRDSVSYALKHMEKKYPSEYLLLWHEYVERLPAQEVAEIIGGTETPKTPQEYRTIRRNAF